MAREAREEMARFPAWAYDSKQEGRVRLKLYALLTPHVAVEDKAGVLKVTVDALLRMSRVVEE
jgi:hypothetical protein